MPRAFDIAIAALALLVLSPVLVIAAIAIKLGSRGPVIYRQRRIGLDGAEFELLKLRTMELGSDPVGIGIAIARDDPRVTAAGRVLRRTSLDEVPNLVNVLRGEMAIVGPRPTIPAQVDDYTPRQRRVGLDGRAFEMLKLRTMVQGSDPVGVGTVVTREDPRVTRAGRFLRRTSFDEVPNLINVLRGEMAIVGPRPTIPAQVDDYTPLQRRRHEVVPGITGWAQVQGRAGIPWEERIELDVWYVDQRSLLLDLRILLRTVWLVISAQGLAPD